MRKDISRHWFVLLVLVLSLLLTAGSARAAGFYKGKVIRVIVGFSPGGGFDTHARTLARHLSKYIPGKPTIIVDNMGGAGSLKAANYISRVSKPDGLTIGMVSGATVMGQLLGRKGIKFDVRKFEIIAAPTPYKTVCVLSKASGITSLEKWKNSKRPVKFGMTGPGASAHDVPLVLNAALGLPVKPVPGYKGTSKVRLAVESGEVDGTCFAWDSMKATWKAKLESGALIPVIQTFKTKQPDLPNVPNAIDLAKTPEARALIEMGIHAPGMVNRYYTLPPKTPKDRVSILRKAFLAAFKDPAFLADAKKARLEIEPLTAAEVSKNMEALFSMKPALAKKLKKIIARKAIR
ncbi:MAG TPA: hypothetical protein DDZ83_05960 [Nitrospinae bacterium]|nr:hypothetical protein [Nitrospinota bacterium]